MQVSAEVVLQSFLASIGMLQRTSGHCWQAPIAWDPPAALARALRALTGRFEVGLRARPSISRAAQGLQLTGEPLLTAQDPHLRDPGST